MSTYIKVSYAPTTCPCCDAVYTPKRKDQKACSPKCGWTLRNMQNYSNGQPRTCAVCETAFITRVNKKYCSDECRTHATKAWHDTRHIENTYGITLSDYDAQLKSQGGCCHLCGTDTPGGIGRFHIDHDHETGKLRGLLCSNCNRALGFFKDDAALMLRAADYVMNGGSWNGI